jgi:hypothetical protein
MITMKTMNRFVLAVSLFGAPALFAADSGQQSSYEQAVESYIDGATQQLRAIRTEVDAAVAKAGDTGRQTYAEVYRGLDQCDAMVARLRVAGTRDFDPIKTRFEETRAQMIATLDTFKKVTPVAPSAPPPASN